MADPSFNSISQLLLFFKYPTLCQAHSFTIKNHLNFRYTCIIFSKTMQSEIPRPAYDEELGKTLATLNFPVTITPELIPAIRSRATPSGDEITSGHPVSHDERIIQGPHDDITLSIFRSTTSTSSSQTHPGILWIHGGGFFSGNRFGGIPNLLSFVEDLDAVCISVEYHLAPEYPDRHQSTIATQP
jgi:acetyl esterase/lipase